MHMRASFTCGLTFSYHTSGMLLQARSGVAAGHRLGCSAGMPTRARSAGMPTCPWSCTSLASCGKIPGHPDTACISASMHDIAIMCAAYPNPSPVLATGYMQAFGFDIHAFAARAVAQA